MIRLAAAALTLLVGGAQPGPPPLERQMQIVVQQRIVIRVPRGEPRMQANAGAAVRWREANGPRCIPARQVAGAVPSTGTVDLVMHDSRRFRAHLGGRCAGLDYYRGLYVEAHPDGQICAQRDAIRSRMGGQCAITQFRQLQAVRR